MEATFIPEVNDELDTQKFEKFEEVFFYTHTMIIYSYAMVMVHVLIVIFIVN